MMTPFDNPDYSRGYDDGLAFAAQQMREWRPEEHPAGCACDCCRLAREAIRRWKAGGLIGYG